MPLVIRGPGFETGAIRDDLTANVDVPATILDGGRRRAAAAARRLLAAQRLSGGSTAQELPRLRDPQRQHRAEVDDRADQQAARSQRDPI